MVEGGDPAPDHGMVEGGDPAPDYGMVEGGDPAPYHLRIMIWSRAVAGHRGPAGGAGVHCDEPAQRGAARGEVHRPSQRLQRGHGRDTERGPVPRACVTP